jgi:hypothetical protein
VTTVVGYEPRADVDPEQLDRVPVRVVEEAIAEVDELQQQVERRSEER